jgi:hypothetical protein
MYILRGAMLVKILAHYMEDRLMKIFVRLFGNRLQKKGPDSSQVLIYTPNGVFSLLLRLFSKFFGDMVHHLGKFRFRVSVSGQMVWRPS